MSRIDVVVTGGPLVPGADPTGLQNLLDEIAEGEGTTDADAARHGFASGYDVPLGYGAYVYRLPRHLQKPISAMTIAEIYELQDDYIRPRSGALNSSAVGRYQIVGRTLRDLQGRLGFSDSTIFSPELQDQLAVELLKKRGVERYLGRTLSRDGFQRGLAYEWASIAIDSSNQSAYGGVASTTNYEIDRAIVGLRA